MREQVRAWAPVGVLITIWSALAVLLGMAGFEGLLGADAHDYLRLARQWTAWAQGAPRPVMVEHPMGYPILGALLGGAFGAEHAALRLVTGLSWVGLVLSGRGILLRSAGPGHAAGLYAMLIIGGAPFVLRYAHTVMSDVPAMAAVLIATACTLRWNERRRWPHLAMAAASGAVAVGLRTACAPLVLVLALTWPWGLPAGRRGWLWVLAAIGVLAGAILIAANAGLPALRTPLQEWSVPHMVARTHTSDDGVLRHTLPNVLYVLGVFVHPGLLPAGLLVLPFVRRNDASVPAVRLALVLLAAYLLLLAGLPFQNDRVLALGQPFAAIALFPAFGRALAWAKERGAARRTVVTVLALVQLLLFVRAMAPFVRQAAEERELAGVVRALRPQVVYTHGMGGPLMEQVPGVAVHELWYGRIDRFEPGALVVVRPATLAAQWTGLPPATNWEAAIAQGARVLWHGPAGWVVAQLPAERR